MSLVLAAWPQTASHINPIGGGGQWVPDKHHPGGPLSARKKWGSHSIAVPGKEEPPGPGTLWTQDGVSTSQEQDVYSLILCSGHCGNDFNPSHLTQDTDSIEEEPKTERLSGTAHVTQQKSPPLNHTVLWRLPRDCLTLDISVHIHHPVQRQNVCLCDRDIPISDMAQFSIIWPFANSLSCWLALARVSSTRTRLG